MIVFHSSARQAGGDLGGAEDLGAHNIMTAFGYRNTPQRLEALKRIRYSGRGFGDNKPMIQNTRGIECSTPFWRVEGWIAAIEKENQVQIYLSGNTPTICEEVVEGASGVMTSFAQLSCDSMMRLVEIYKRRGRHVSHFLDSGAFSLQKQHDPGESFYRGKVFREYLEKYVEFIKANRDGIDLYANIDVIGDTDETAELTWKNQIRLEKRGLEPVPVVHCGTNYKWLKRYVDRGHPIIGLGGLVGKGGTQAARDWVGECFSMIADKDGIPTVKFHGFGVSSYKLLTIYPWWSVDSTTWIKVAINGEVIIPYSDKAGNFDVTKEPYQISVSEGNTSRKVGESCRHLEGMEDRRQLVEKWFKALPLDVEDLGYSYGTRMMANLWYYNWFEAHWKTWPFQVPSRKSPIPRPNAGLKIV